MLCTSKPLYMEWTYIELNQASLADMFVLCLVLINKTCRTPHRGRHWFHSRTGVQERDIHQKNSKNTPIWFYSLVLQFVLWTVLYDACAREGSVDDLND